MAETTTWWLYMIECRGGGIYTGIAIDVARRYACHMAGRGAIYTKLHQPIRLLYREEFPDRRSAAKAERLMKKKDSSAKRTLGARYLQGRAIAPESLAGPRLLPDLDVDPPVDSTE